MVAEIFISGIIGGDYWDQSVDDIGTTAENVRAQFRAYDNPTSITAYINTEGGSITEGFAIHDFLRAQGLPVTTIGSMVYSIGTVILLAGDKDKRYMRPNGRGFVHNPLPNIGIQTDAKGYEELAAMLRKEEAELAAFYNQKTGIAVDELRRIMDQEKLLTPSEMLAMGFISGIADPDAKKPDSSIQPSQMSAKYIPSKEIAIKRTQIINQIQMENENKVLGAIDSLKQDVNKFLSKFKNQAPDLEEEKEENKEQKQPSFEERLAALEAKLNEANKEKELAIQAKKKADEDQKQMIEMINKQTEVINQAEQKIKDLEDLPLGDNKKETAIPGTGGNNPHAWVIESGLAAKFANYVKRNF